jgi:hypothetical protein
MARSSRGLEHLRVKYRHEQMIRAREQRTTWRGERQREAEAAFRSSLTAEERRLWLLYSEAVARVQMR